MNFDRHIADAGFSSLIEYRHDEFSSTKPLSRQDTFLAQFPTNAYVTLVNKVFCNNEIF